MESGAQDQTDEVRLRTLTPALPPHVLAKLSAYIFIKYPLGQHTLAASLRGLNAKWAGEEWTLDLRAVAMVLADLIDQGWDIAASDREIVMQPPGLRLVGETPEQAKSRIRRALHSRRDEQLRENGVRTFCGRMHSQGSAKDGIASVIDDGAELAEALRSALDASAENPADALRGVVDPVIEVCDEESRCQATGLRLLDIWRYFRHTWSLEYRPTPGRKMPLLVRNAARPGRPVMGIAMLASPVVRMKSRDNWIGWNLEPFLDELTSGRIDAQEGLRMLVSRLERSIAEIRWDDLATADEIALPSERVVLRLEQRAAGAGAMRENSRRRRGEAEEGEVAEEDQLPPNWASVEDVDLQAESEKPLFVQKRASTLAELLDAKRTFQTIEWSGEGVALLDQVRRHPNGLRSVETALREVRKAGLASLVSDVSVCGAVAPYGPLLGGKLVALLMMSKEVGDAYTKRYGRSASIIASQMAGRPIVRPATLRLLTTTSLYGNGSSQYNRLNLCGADFPELGRDIRWNELPQQTAGYGSVHLSKETVATLRAVSVKAFGVARVNNRFGEGASPRLRQTREALSLLGIDPSDVMQHSTPRIVYAAELCVDARRALLGLSPSPEADESPTAAVIGGAWRKRWLTGRVRNPEVLQQVSALGSQTYESMFDEVWKADELQSDTGDANLSA